MNKKINPTSSQSDKKFNDRISQSEENFNDKNSQSNAWLYRVLSIKKLAPNQKAFSL
jgi:hypothetical protein